MSYKKALIITDQDVQSEEFNYPISRLLEEDFEIDLLLTGSMNATDKVGTNLREYFLKCVPHGNVFSFIESDTYDIYIIPGGFAPEKVRLNKGAIKLLNVANSNSKILAAICHGPQVLMSIPGLCGGKNMTCFVGVKDDLNNAGAFYQDAPVVVDGNIITSPHYKYNHVFMRTILDEYNKYVLGNYGVH